MPMHVEVVTQEKKLFEDPSVDMVIVPGTEGQLGILPRHTPLLTTMTYGELIVRKGGAEEVFAIYGGVVDVRPDKVVVLADAADFADEINIQEVEEARERAQRMLQEGVPPEDEAFIAAQLKRAELAINLSRKTRSGGGRVKIRVMQQEERDNNR